MKDMGGPDTCPLYSELEGIDITTRVSTWGKDWEMLEVDVQQLSGYHFRLVAKYPPVVKLPPDLASYL